MARVKRSVAGRKSRKATLQQAKGYYGNKSRSYRAANEQVMHSGNYAFRDRRARKGEFRRLWIQRINAAARQNGTSYSKLVNGLNAAGVQVDRKILSEMAVNDPEAFSKLVEKAESARQASCLFPPNHPDLSVSGAWSAIAVFETANTKRLLKARVP